MKSFLQKIFALKIALLILLNLTSISYSQEGNGYVNPLSYTKGDTVKFHISTSKPFFSMRIFRQGSGETTVGVYDSIKGSVWPVPDSVWEKGCSWPVTFKIVIPDNWQPGAYVARFPDLDADNISNLVFLVKDKNPGSFSKLLVVIPYFNWVAYNNWGGKNVYDDNSTDHQRAYRVSLNRPFVGNGYSEFRGWAEKFIGWLEKNNYKYEVASEMDIHKDPEFLKNYKLMIVPGHDEYYTRAQRLNIQKFINEGGKYMSLSGNTCWWQVRIEDDFNTLVCYKNRQLDPLYGKIDSLVTVNWYDQPLNYPENIFLGASFRNAGYVNDIHHTDFTYSQGFGDYAVFNSQNWVYNGTGLKDGDEFGRPDSASAAVGYEVDGALFSWKSGVPEVTGLDGTPMNFRILGISPAIGQGDIKLNRYATMGIFTTKGGGAVFNASSINWSSALAKDKNVHLITKNVIDKFMSDRFPPEINSWSPHKLATDTVNGMAVQINRRELEAKTGDTLTFSLAAVDPYGQKMSHTWVIDSVKVSNDSTCRFIPKLAGSYNVTGFIFNLKDTASLNWTITVKGEPVQVKAPKAKTFSYRLSQNYPNPFNPETTIEYSLAYESNVTLKVYNAIGQLVVTLVNSVEKAGSYSTKWIIGGMPSGIYFYHLEAASLNGNGNFSSVKKMIVLK